MNKVRKGRRVYTTLNCGWKSDAWGYLYVLGEKHKEQLVHGGTFLVAQMVKCLPAMRETWVQSLGREDPLEKEMATHSSTLARKIPWMEEPGGL